MVFRVQRYLAGTTPVFVAGGLCSLAQSQFLFVLPWMILARGGSPSTAILSVGTAVLPYVVCSPLAGLVGDRVSPRFVLTTTYAVTACAAAAYPVAGVAGHAPFALIIAGAVVFGSAKPFADAGTYRAIATEEGRRVLRRQAINAVLLQTGTFGGPAIGLALFHWVGASGVCTGIAVMLACSAVLALRTDRGDSGGQRASMRVAARSGAHYLRTDPKLRRVVLGIAVWNLVAGAAFSIVSPLLERAGISETGASGVFLAGAAGVLFLTFPTVQLALRRLNAAALFGTAVIGEGAAFWVFSRFLGEETFALYGCFLVANSVAACAASGARAVAIRIHEQALLNVSSMAISSVAYVSGVFLAGVSARVLGLPRVALLLAACLVALGVALEVLQYRWRSEFAA